MRLIYDQSGKNTSIHISRCRQRKNLSKQMQVGIVDQVLKELLTCMHAKKKIENKRSN